MRFCIADHCPECGVCVRRATLIPVGSLEHASDCSEKEDADDRA